MGAEQGKIHKHQTDSKRTISQVKDDVEEQLKHFLDNLNIQGKDRENIESLSLTKKAQLIVGYKKRLESFQGEQIQKSESLKYIKTLEQDPSVSNLKKLEEFFLKCSKIDFEVSFKYKGFFIYKGDLVLMSILEKHSNQKNDTLDVVLTIICIFVSVIQKHSGVAKQILRVKNHLLEQLKYVWYCLLFKPEQ